MRYVQIVFAGLLLFSSASATAQDVGYNFDKDADFSSYKTYKWVDVDKGEKLDDITHKQIRAAIDVELAKKGFTRTESDDADLYIGYQAAVKQEKELTVYGSSYGYGPGWGPGWYGYRGRISTSTTGRSFTILKGILDLDVYDVKAKRLVWRGIASKTIDETASAAKREKNINNGAKKLLKDFPPKQKKK